MKSKRGDTIAFVILDDRSARLEVSVFGKEYEQFRDLLQKDAILVIDCVVSIDDYSGSMRGRAKHIVNLDQARALFARSLELHLHSDYLMPDFPAGLTRILEAHKVEPVVIAPVPEPVPAPRDSKGRAPSSLASGKSTCPVRVFYERPGSKGCVELGEDWAVKPSQALLHRLEEEFGRARVKLSY